MQQRVGGRPGGYPVGPMPPVAWGRIFMSDRNDGIVGAALVIETWMRLHRTGVPRAHHDSDSRRLILFSVVFRGWIMNYIHIYS